MSSSNSSLWGLTIAEASSTVSYSWLKLLEPFLQTPGAPPSAAASLAPSSLGHAAFLIPLWPRPPHLLPTAAGSHKSPVPKRQALPSRDFFPVPGFHFGSRKAWSMLSRGRSPWNNHCQSQSRADTTQKLLSQDPMEVQLSEDGSSISRPDS